MVAEVRLSLSAIAIATTQDLVVNDHILHSFMENIFVHTCCNID